MLRTALCHADPSSQRERAKLHVLSSRSPFRAYWILTDTILTPTAGTKNNLEPDRVGIAGRATAPLTIDHHWKINTGRRNEFLSEFPTLFFGSVEKIITPRPSALPHDLNPWNMAVHKVNLLEKGC